MIIDNISQSGKAGKDGLTPFVGENGNWFLGETDTGVAAKAQGNTKIVEVTLLANDWSDSLEQTISCEGISANEANQMVTLLPALANKAVYSSCRVTCTAFAANSLTFMAESLPEEDILVYVAMEDEHASVANDIHSTEETVIGTWIDGKPIYRKVFCGLTIPTQAVDLVLTYANIDVDTMTSIRGLGVQANSNRCVFPNPDMHLYYNAQDGSIMAWCNNSHFINIPVTVVIEYTKLSDTATIEIPSATALMDAYEEGVNEA